MRGHVYVGELSVEVGGEKQTLLKNFSRSFSSVGGMQAAFKDAGLSSRVALVGCGAQKSLKPCKAKDLYTSNLLPDALPPADRALPLHAEVVRLDDALRVEQPELGAEDEPPRAGRLGVGARRSEQIDQALPYPAMADATLVCLAGRPYADAIDFGDREFHWEEPLRGLGLGKRISWLKNNTPETR